MSHASVVCSITERDLFLSYFLRKSKKAVQKNDRSFFVGMMWAGHKNCIKKFGTRTEGPEHPDDVATKEWEQNILTNL